MTEYGIAAAKELEDFLQSFESNENEEKKRHFYNVSKQIAESHKGGCGCIHCGHSYHDYDVGRP